MEISMHKSVPGLVGLSVFFAFQSLAASELGEVVVTANRSAHSLDTTLAATTVLTRAQIENLQASMASPSATAVVPAS
jgi:outer membrane cobalamin receptor